MKQFTIECFWGCHCAIIQKFIFKFFLILFLYLCLFCYCITLLLLYYILVVSCVLCIYSCSLCMWHSLILFLYVVYPGLCWKSALHLVDPLVKYYNYCNSDTETPSSITRIPVVWVVSWFGLEFVSIAYYKYLYNCKPQWHFNFSWESPRSLWW